MHASNCHSDSINTCRCSDVPCSLRRVVPTGGHLLNQVSCMNSWPPRNTVKFREAKYSKCIITNKVHKFGKSFHFCIINIFLSITAHLGAGQFGTVNKGIWQSRAGAKDVAIKMLKKGSSEEEKVKLLQEAAINGQFRHINVVKLLGVVTLDEPVSCWLILSVVSKVMLPAHMLGHDCA